VHHLYDYLDEGKIVLIDIFATWCPNCIASIPGVEQIWEEHGPDGDNSIVILGFERDPATSNELLFAYTHGIAHPIISEAHETVESWGITYQPNYFVICPDRTWDLKAGAIGSNPAPLLALSEQCAPLSLDSTPQKAARVELSFSLDKLTIALTDGQELWRIFDMSGREVMNGTAQEGENTVFTHQLQTGVYVLILAGKSHKFAR
jgi:thiol-disulfide isomerase/thioredoxin